MGATQASAGMLAPYIEAREGHRCSTSPSAAWTSSTTSSRAWSPRAASPSRTGAPARSTVATDDARWQRSAGDRRRSVALRACRRLLDAAAARAEEPHLATASIGGLLIDDARIRRRQRSDARARHGRAPPRRAVGRAEPRAADLHEGRRLVVETDRGSLTGNAVVLAAGSWSGDIEIDGVSRAVPVRPVRGQLLYLAWTGTPLAARDLEQPLLSRAVGRWHGAGRRDDGGSRVRRARRRWPACAICSSGAARSCRTRGRPVSAARASDCGRARPTICRSSARRPRCRT